MAKASDTLVHLGDHAGFEDRLRTSRRVLMSYLFCFPPLAIFILSYELHWMRYPLLFGLAAVLAVLFLLTITRFVIKLELVMDRERQQLLIRRRFFFFQHLVSLAGVEELWGVTTAGEVPAAPVNYWWDYVTLLITRKGQRFRAARHGKEYRKAEYASQDLADQLGIPYIAGQADHKVTVVPNHPEPYVEFNEFNLKRADGFSVLFWGFAIFLIPGLAIALAIPPG